MLCKILARSHVMTPTTHAEKAQAHLDAVATHRSALDELYVDPHHDRRRAASLHDQIRLGLKLAEVNAELAIVDAIVLSSKMPEVDRNARAYGWEVGQGQEPSAQLVTTPGNPFVEAGA